MRRASLHPPPQFFQRTSRPLPIPLQCFPPSASQEALADTENGILVHFYHPCYDTTSSLVVVAIPFRTRVVADNQLILPPVQVPRVCF